MHAVPVDVGNNFIAQDKKGFLVGFLIFMNVDRRDCKGTITVCRNFFTGDAFIILFDVNHQHM